LTVCDRAGEVDAAKFVSPPYSAVTECTPPVNIEVLNVAAPPDNVPVPRTVVSSLKVTVPVAVDGVTEAVKVTIVPKVDGLSDDVTSVDVDAWFTIKVSEAELAPKFPWAAYSAFKVCGPALGPGIVKVEAPLISPCVVAAPPSTLNDTFPVGVPAAELTVTVTMPSVPYVTAGALSDIVVAPKPTPRVPEAELAPKFP